MAANPSALFAVNGGSPGVKASVTAGSTVTCVLDDVSGVTSTTWSIASADETTDPSSFTLSVSGLHQETMTFTAPASPGKAVIVQATVNSGLLPSTGSISPDLTSTCKVYVPTAGAGEVGCAGEAYESDATYGSTGIINYGVRNVAGSAVLSVTGTPPIVSSGGQNPAISITAASAIAAGSMSASDYSKLAGLPSSAVPTSRTLTGTSPIQIDGSNSAQDLSANRTISILAASGSNAGSQSIAHYNLVNNATSSPTADTLAKRGASGELAGVWFAPALTGVATSGVLRTSSASQTILGSRNAANSANIAVVAIDGADGIAIGDANTALLSLAGGGGGATLSGLSLDIDKPVLAPYFADTSAHIATTGVFRSTGDAQTIVGARNAADAADISVLSIDGSDGLTVGDATDAASVTVAAGSSTAKVDSAGLLVETGAIDWTLAAPQTGSPTPTSIISKPQITITQTTDATPTAVWSYTMTANALVTIRLTLIAQHSNEEMFHERLIRASNVGTVTSYFETIATDRNTITGAGVPTVAYAESGGIITATATGIAATTIKWLVRGEILSVVFA